MKAWWRYRILEQVGQGSCGQVHRARHRWTGHEVAFKELAIGAGEVGAARSRLMRESVALAMLDHPGIVRHHGIERHGDGIAVVMEYVDGATLHDLLQYGPLSLDASTYVTRSLLQALDHAHDCGVVHRDVSPRNVLVSRTGEVKLADFGIAKLAGSTRTAGHAEGTVPYMAPEQILGLDVDGRADLFAVGALFYAMATGQSPFTGRTAHEMEARILCAEPAVADRVPGELAPIIQRLLARERDQRFPAAGAVLAELPPAHDGQEALVDLVRVRAPERATPRRLRPWGLGLVAVGLAGALAWFAYPRTEKATDTSTTDVSVREAAPEPAPIPHQRHDMTPPRRESSVVTAESDSDELVSDQERAETIERRRAPGTRARRSRDRSPETTPATLDQHPSSDPSWSKASARREAWQPLSASHRREDADSSDPDPDRRDGP